MKCEICGIRIPTNLRDGDICKECYANDGAKDEAMAEALDEENKCICNEGIHNGNEVDCACKCHEVTE